MLLGPRQKAALVVRSCLAANSLLHLSANPSPHIVVSTLRGVTAGTTRPDFKLTSEASVAADSLQCFNGFWAISDGMIVRRMMLEQEHMAFPNTTSETVS